MDKSNLIFGDLQALSKITLWEKFCLLFVKKIVVKDEYTTLVYKKKFGKMYILENFQNPPNQS